MIINYGSVHKPGSAAQYIEIALLNRINKDAMKYGAIQDGDLPAICRHSPRDIHEDIASPPPGLFTRRRGLTTELPASSGRDNTFA